MEIAHKYLDYQMTVQFPRAVRTTTVKGIYPRAHFSCQGLVLLTCDFYPDTIQVSLSDEGQQTSHSLNLACHLLLYVLQAQNGSQFYIFLSSLKIKRRVFHMWKLYEIQISISTNDVLLKHCPVPIHLYVICVYSHTSMAELSTCNRSCMASKT